MQDAVTALSSSKSPLSRSSTEAALLLSPRQYRGGGVSSTLSSSSVGLPHCPCWYEGKGCTRFLMEEEINSVTERVLELYWQKVLGND